mmetsp:Transcript_25808/g.86735  ORF Transcript_25808/g.86735 Transcript_25808/m.86735 type:complete len:293 (+) Transcript_25808:286-1164(+)
MTGMPCDIQKRSLVGGRFIVDVRRSGGQIIATSISKTFLSSWKRAWSASTIERLTGIDGAMRLHSLATGLGHKRSRVVDRSPALYVMAWLMMAKAWKPASQAPRLILCSVFSSGNWCALPARNPTRHGLRETWAPVATKPGLVTWWYQTSARCAPSCVLSASVCVSTTSTPQGSGRLGGSASRRVSISRLSKTSKKTTAPRRRHQSDTSGSTACCRHALTTTHASSGAVNASDSSSSTIAVLAAHRGARPVRARNARPSALIASVRTLPRSRADPDLLKRTKRTERVPLRLT